MSCRRRPPVSDAVGLPVFEAVIVPHRSLSQRSRRRLLAGLALLCAGNAALFVHLGAWPVSGFCGLELLLAGVLLEVNAHGARRSELVLLSEQTLRIVRTDPKGVRSERRLSAAWLQVQLQDETPGRVPRLLLLAQGDREEIAASLGEREKRDLAAALANALDALRNPVFDNHQLRHAD